ncbi:MAG: BTAD domain-containing putative transcriptional regulator [Pseudomonadota bacterium]
MTARKLRVRLMGGFGVNAESDLSFPTRKTASLFAYLCLKGGNAASREELKSLFWETSGEAQAASSLRRALSDLRSIFTDAEVAPIVLSTTATVSVRMPGVEIDAVQFEEGHGSQSEEQMRDAARLYAGPLMDQTRHVSTGFEEWLLTERARFQDMAADLCERLAHSASETDSFSEAERLSKRLIREDPLCEQAHRALILCLLRTGRRNAALRQFEDCSAILQSELQVEPEEQTKALLKSISESVSAKPVEPRTNDTISKPKIAVLPMENLSGDPEEAYFSDGISLDITTELARFSSLSVVARSSTFVFRERAVDLADAAKTLGADFLLRGSLRRAGDCVRLTTQLIEAQTSNQIWAERYDRQVSDIFTIQDKLVHSVVSVLPGQIEASLRRRVLRQPAENMQAYDLYLKGLEHERHYNHANVTRGLHTMTRAIELDPRFARAHALLSFFTFAEQWFRNRLDPATLERAVDLGQRAIALDPNDNDCLAKLGTAYLAKCDYEQARHYLERALEMNPHDCWTWSHYAWLLTTVGQHSKAIDYMDHREKIDPFPPAWHWETRGISEYSLSSYSQAAVSLRRIVDPGFWIHGYLAACYGQLGEREMAQAEWRIMRDMRPDVSVDDLFVAQSDTMQQENDVMHWRDGLLKAGLIN